MGLSYTWAILWRSNKLNASGFQRLLQDVKRTGITRWNAFIGFYASNRRNAQLSLVCKFFR
jgi:hypothetical protein